MKTTEHDEQAAVIEWAEAMRSRIPELALLFAVPNGGYRHPATAARLKREGVRAGVPDLCLPVPRGKWHGLFIEMKAGGNKPTPEQRDWLSLLTSQGYRAVVANGAEMAKAVIETYLKGEE